MKHEYEEHENCDRAHCNICDGGLAICKVCHCAEGSLATDCPGYPCHTTHGERIYKGEIDFVEDRWVEKRVSENSPVKFR